MVDFADSVRNDENLAMPIAVVAVNAPVVRPFSYRIPDALRGRVQLGSRVRVPFGSRQLFGTVIGFQEQSPVAGLKDIDAVMADEASTTPQLMRLCLWMADYYAASVGEVLSAVLPGSVKRGRRSQEQQLVCLAIPAPDALRLSEELLAKREKQARVLRILAEAHAPVEISDLIARALVTRSPVLTLVKNRLLEITHARVERDVLASVPPERSTPPALTQEQQKALDAITDSLARTVPGAFLLFGVTGSGKTEVYLRAIQHAIAEGKQAIVLVPEIALTPQTVARFKGRFERVAVLHSGLSDAERAHQWGMVRAGVADVVIGARSAVFAPLQNLGLIVIDEEHENTFKQQQAPRYHARDVALMRGVYEGAAVVLGSATPSLESFANARRGKLELLTLTERVGGGRWPDSRVVDLSLRSGKEKGLISESLRQALIDTVNRREQAILFLNRRGFAPAAYCGRCKASIACESCSVPLTLHRRSRRLLCHYCGREMLPPRLCPTCQQNGIVFLGFGTEKVEEEVERIVPHARVGRMDSDTTAARGAHEQILNAFGDGQVDILVGTQMIAKGLDFPRVTLVGVLIADAALNIPDFRSAERTFQLIAQVTGRAGRSARGGLVVVQAFAPDHFAIRTALAHDYVTFAERELSLRRGGGYPPFTHLVRIVVAGEKESAVEQAAGELAHELRPQCSEHDVQMLGPAPAPLKKLSGNHRHHILLRCARRKPLRQVLYWLAQKRLAKGARMIVDVDPQSMM